MLKTKHFKQLNAPKSKPKWKRITLPKDILKRPVDSAAFSIKDVSNQSVCTANSNDIDYLVGHTSQIDPKHSLGEAFLCHTAQNFKNGLHLVSKAHEPSQEPVRIKYMMGENICMAENNLIEVNEADQLSVALIYENHDTTIRNKKMNTSSRHHGVTRIVARKNSQLNLIRFQNLDDSGEFFDNIFFDIEEGAQVRFFDYQVGGRLKAVSCLADLKGYHSQIEIYSGYLGLHTEQLDLSYTVRHFGSQSRSKILGKGALDGKSKKVFRGTLDFKSGSKSATGQEEEFVLLMHRNAHSDSIPALLCEEDDVIGEHAASVGRINTDQLFYMMSRGYSLGQARQTLIMASITETLETLSSPELAQNIQAAFERRIEGIDHVTTS